MLEEKFEELNDKLDSILKIHRSLPTWYPLTIEFAKECGYKTVDGLQKWCYRNLPPDDFVQRGRYWFIHIKSIHSAKMKLSWYTICLSVTDISRKLNDTSCLFEPTWDYNFRQ